MEVGYEDVQWWTVMLVVCFVTRESVSTCTIFNVIKE